MIGRRERRVLCVNETATKEAREGKKNRERGGGGEREGKPAARLLSSPLFGLCLRLYPTIAFSLIHFKKGVTVE